MIGNFATEIFKINIGWISGFIIRSLTVAARIMDQTEPQPSNRATTIKPSRDRQTEPRPSGSG